MLDIKNQIDIYLHQNTEYIVILLTVIGDCFVQ